MAYDPNEWGEWAGRENFVYKLRRLEEGLAETSWGADPADIAVAVENYLTANPLTGINPAELEGAILSYLTLNPPKGELDPDEVAAAVVQYLADNSIVTKTITAAEDSDHKRDFGAAGTVLDVTVDGPCRVRAYRTSDERTADASRPFWTPYLAENGLLYDYLFLEARADLGRPWYYAGDVFVRVDGGPVDITFRYVTTGVEA